MFKFQLQLFADEGTETGNESATEIPEGAGEVVTEPSVEDNGSNPDVAVKVDPNTGDRTVEFTQEEPTEEVPQEEPTVEETTEPQEQEQKFYTDSEFLEAYGKGVVNPAMVTPEQQAQITAARQKEMAYQQAAFERQRAEQIRNEQLATARKQNLGRIAAEARLLALQQAGLTEDDLNNLDYVEGGEEKKRAFEMAYSNNFSNLFYNMAEQEVRMKQQYETNAASMQEISVFCEQERVSEPHFLEILELMNTARNTMPYEKAVKIIQSEQNLSNQCCTQQDLATIREYYDECKKMIYQQSAQVSKVPKRTAVPNVEKSGTPNVQTESFDFAKLRGMSQYDRDAAVMRYIRNQA